MQRLTEKQMLVNQALVEKVVASQLTEASLRASEQKLHALLAHQRASNTAERERMSLELHDCLGQNLLALRLDMVILHQHTKARRPRLHRRVGAALDNIDEALRTVKALLSELQPAGFELGVVAAVEIEASKFSHASGIECIVQAQEHLERLEIDVDILRSLFSLLRESLNNVLQHSLASRVQLGLASANGMIELTVSDNGVGFNPQAPCKPSSFGLAIQQEQIAAHGGDLVIDSAWASGTRLVVRLPI